MRTTVLEVLKNAMHKLNFSIIQDKSYAETLVTEALEQLNAVIVAFERGKGPHDIF